MYIQWSLCIRVHTYTEIPLQPVCFLSLRMCVHPTTGFDPNNVWVSQICECHMTACFDWAAPGTPTGHGHMLWYQRLLHSSYIFVTSPIIYIVSLVSTWSWSIFSVERNGGTYAGIEFSSVQQTPDNCIQTVGNSHVYIYICAARKREKERCVNNHTSVVYSFHTCFESAGLLVCRS